MKIDQHSAVRVAVMVREPEHHSLRLYRDALFRRLPARGVALHTFSESEPVPNDCDLVWDPGLGMREVPSRWQAVTKPLVVTVLGLRAFVVPSHLLCADAAEIEREQLLKRDMLAGWQALRPGPTAVITISRTCAMEITEHLGVPQAKVHPIHLAVDRDVFTPGSGKWRRHLLYVALNTAARKNLNRILEAYDSLPWLTRPPLVLKLQQPPQGIALPHGVRVALGFCDDAEMARLYCKARALLFPSIYEGFGLPIVEAMSCGCPVITSDRGACAEVAAGAALTVDPLSTDSLADALRTILRDRKLARDLVARGLKRASDFSWDRCADEHAALFHRIAAAAR